MEKIIIDLEAKTDKAVKGIEKVAKEVQELNKEVVSSNKDTAKSLKGVEKASKLAAGGIKAIGTTLKAIGIGLVISALASLKDLFSQNQKVVDVFNVAFETLGQLVSQTVNAFTDIYNELTKTSDQFDALGKVIGGLTTIYMTPLKLAFYGIKLAVQEAMLAWEQSFFGGKDKETIKELNLSILETKDNIISVGEDAVQAGKDVVNNFGEAITEVVDGSKVVVKELGEVSVKAAIQTAKANNEIQKSAELAAARQGLIFEKFDRQAEKLRQVRDEERNSIEERKKANDALLVEIDKAEQASLAQAQLQLSIANANLAKDKDNVEFKVAQIEATRELAAVQAQFEGIRSEQLANDLALSKELTEIDKTRAESQSKIANDKKRFNAEQIDDELLRLEKLKEIAALEQEQEQIRLQALIDNENAGTQAKIDAQIALDEFNEQSRQTNITRDQEIATAEIKIEEEKRNARSQTLNNLVSIAGAETAIGKAALIAKQILMAKELVMEVSKTISFATQASARSAVAMAEGSAQTAKIGFPQNIPMLIGYAAQAVGIFSAIKSATSKAKVSAPPQPSIPTPSATPTPSSVPPSFNVVGGGATNQLAEAIGGQSQQPVQAYVVANDVTTSQSLDRNIVEGASI